MHHIAPDNGRNAGLVNNNVLCYANAIFQIIASCGCLNESLSNPPNRAYQHFRIYYNFASVISST
jgi:ubiquitin C-terminal hydrolase